MTKIKIIIVLIFTGIVLSVGLYDNEKRYPTNDYRMLLLKYMAKAGTDSVFTLSMDSLKEYLQNEGFTDTLALADTLAAIESRYEQAITDSLGQDPLVIPNDLTTHGNIRLDNDKYIEFGDARIYEKYDGLTDYSGDFFLSADNGENIRLEADSVVFQDGILKLETNSGAVIEQQTATEMRLVEDNIYLNADSTYLGVSTETQKLTVDTISSTGDLSIDADNTEFEGSVKVNDDSLILHAQDEGFASKMLFRAEKLFGGGTQEAKIELSPGTAPFLQIYAPSADGSTTLAMQIEDDNVNYNTGKFTIGGDVSYLEKLKEYTSDSLLICSDYVTMCADQEFIVESPSRFKDLLYIGTDGAYFEASGDTLYTVEAVHKAQGRFASQDGYYLDNGFSIVPTSADSVTMSGVEKTYLVSQFIPNPYFSTSPTSTVIGEGAGKTGMSGDDNVFVGNYSGSANTSGYRNTFNGYYAGYANTTGNRNIFNGYSAGYSNTEGYYNTFNGYYAGRANTSGNRNTFNGNGAGYANTTGYNNTFNGATAGRSNTTGSFNTALGDSAAYNMTEGNRNIVIGSKATLVNEDDSDKLIIGSAKWNGATLEQRRIIEGDFSTAIVTINNVLTLTPIATANRPATPAEGMMYMDSTVDSLKIYINSKWFNISMTEE